MELIQLLSIICLTALCSAEDLNETDVPVPRAELQSLWSEVFTSETVEMSCSMVGSPDNWTYTWYRGGQEVQNPAGGPDGSSLNISSASPEDGGQYTCTGQLNGKPVGSKPSNTLSLTVDSGTAQPVLTKSPSVQEMYTGEVVTFGCKMALSTGWVYQWYQNNTRLHTEETTGSYVIPSASSSDSGTYECRATRGHQTPPFTSQSSPVQNLLVSDIPKPSVQLITLWPDVFPTEKVELGCRVEGSSVWSFTWYRNGSEIEAVGDGATLTIGDATAGHSGQYVCEGRHSSRSVTTNTSDGLTLQVYDKIPTAEIRQDGGYEKMYPEESLTFRCEVGRSSGWEFLWFHNKVKLPTRGENYSIPSVAPGNAGAYRCRATRGHKTLFSTLQSTTLQIQVEALPKATLSLLTDWSEVFSTDRLDLKCEVKGSQYLWNYTWTKGGQQLVSHREKHVVTPDEDPDQSEYICKGARDWRPLYSMASEPFQTKNLLLKRRLLLSISGCLFFGIIGVFLGCIALRLTRKRVKIEEEEKEPNLFLTMAELRACEVSPCPLADYVTDEALVALTKDGDARDTAGSESTALTLCFPESEAETPSAHDPADHSANLTSFKY